MPLATEQVSQTTRRASVAATVAVYWHLLSLDAPTVAALWCWSLGKVARIELPALAPWLLAVGTWLVYVADRILDGLDSESRDRLRERHYFYLQHRTAFLVAGAVISLFFAWAVFTVLSPAVRFEDAAVFAVAALYFLLVHVHGRKVERWLPKELAVGVLFAAGTTVPVWARASEERLALVPVVAVFAILCWLNCVAIESWEDSTWRGATPAAHSTTVWAGQRLQTLALSTAVFSLGLAFASMRDSTRICFFLASAMSALLLFWLARRRQYLSVLQVRISADAALLTPLLFWACMR